MGVGLWQKLGAEVSVSPLGATPDYMALIIDVYRKMASTLRNTNGYALSHYQCLFQLIYLFYVYCIFRLEAYDRNCNFNCTQGLEPEYSMSVPECTTYKDLHADMKVPTVTMGSVGVYLHMYNKIVDKASTDLYNDGFVNYIRLAAVDSSFFF